MHMAVQVQPLTKPPRTEESESENCLQRPMPLTDFYGEDRHELMQKLAYQHWEERGSPLGSPEVDWFAAEKFARTYLLASGIELGFDEDLYS
jgi:hypothetical protein